MATVAKRQRGFEAIGWISLFLTCFAIVLQQSAMAVIVDLRVAIVVLGSVSMLLLAKRWRTAGSHAVITIPLLASIAAVTVIILDRFRYRTEEIAFDSNGTILRGTLYLPRSDRLHPAVVLVHGAGPEDRSEYRYYARMYAKRGIVALAYDKRGSGKSEGDVSAATFEQLAADASSAMQFLRGRPEVDSGRVGLWGLSEGEWIAPLAAVVSRPAFLVLVSASAMTPSEQVQYETWANVIAAGFPEGDADKARRLYAQLARFQRDGSNRDSLNHALALASNEPWFESSENLESSVPEYTRVLQISWFLPWRSRMDFNALPLMRDGEYPVLALVGGRDPQNDGQRALERLRQSVGVARFSGEFYQNAEHGMIEWRLPFRLPPPWFADGYLERQLDWVVEQTTQ